MTDDAFLTRKTTNDLVEEPKRKLIGNPLI